MDLEIIWTEPALEAFESAVRYIAERNPTAAEKVRQSILDHVETLSRFPYIGPRYEHDPNGRTREIVCRPYRIFYRVEESVGRVEILTVWHSSRQEPTLPE